jgi:hypothetical protein
MEKRIYSSKLVLDLIKLSKYNRKKVKNRWSLLLSCLAKHCTEPGGGGSPGLLWAAYWSHIYNGGGAEVEGEEWTPINRMSFL